MLDIVIAAMLASAWAGEGGASAGPTTTAAQPAATLGQPAAPPNKDIVVKGEKPKERRMICRTETPTGSSFPKRICRSLAQIEDDRAKSMKLVNEAARMQALQVRPDISDNTKN